MSRSGTHPLIDLEELREALHAMSQPLTALVLLVELAHEFGSGAEMGAMLAQAREQSARTLQAFEQLRALGRRAQQI